MTIDWRKQLGLEIAHQLPENADDALIVLDHARALVVTLNAAAPTKAGIVPNLPRK